MTHFLKHTRIWGISSNSKYIEDIKTQPLFNLIKLALFLMGKSAEFMISAVFFIVQKCVIPLTAA
jgi:hypothetical protein